MPIIKFTNVSVDFDGVRALEDISFEIKKGEYVGLIGPNGAGKSTLLKVILGFVKPSSGTVKTDSLKKFSYVSQKNVMQSNFSLSVLEVMEMGLERKSIFRNSSEIDKLEKHLCQVSLDKSYLARSFHELSGGQKQRVLIARALLNNAEVLLFDEPLTGLDYHSKIQVYKLLAKINKELKTTIIFVSHEIEGILEKASKILCLNRVLHQGCHPVDFIEGKLDSCNVLKKTEVIRPIHHHHKK